MLHSSQFDPLRLQHPIISLITPYLSFIDRTRILGVLTRSDTILLWEKLVFSPNFYFPPNSIALSWLLGAMWAMLTSLVLLEVLGMTSRWYHSDQCTVCPACPPSGMVMVFGHSNGDHFICLASRKHKSPGALLCGHEVWAACYCRPPRSGDYTVLSFPGYISSVTIAFVPSPPPPLAVPWTHWAPSCLKHWQMQSCLRIYTAQVLLEYKKESWLLK